MFKINNNSLDLNLNYKQMKKNKKQISVVKPTQISNHREKQIIEKPIDHYGQQLLKH